MEKENNCSFKGTKGNWEVCYNHYAKEPKKICVGVGIVTNTKIGTYTEFICNSILPNTDVEYINQQEKIEADMNLIAAAPKMLNALKELIKCYEKGQLLSFNIDIARQAIAEAI